MGHLALRNSEAVHLLVGLAIIYVLARAFGAVARRVHQPEVVGYLLAGVLVGPSALGAAWRSVATFMLPPHGESHLLGAISEFSLLMVLIVLGAETDLHLLRRLGRPAAAITVTGVILPLLVASSAAYAFRKSLVAGNGVSGAVLIGGALAVSSLPIIARLVSELGVARRDFGQMAIGVAAANDVYGFFLLAIVAASTQTGGIWEFARPLGGLVLLLGVFALVGQRGIDSLLRRARQAGPNPTGSVAVAIGAALAASAAMQLIGVEAALGAFFVGVVIGRSRFQQGGALTQLRSFSDAVFAPIYFASAGLLVDLGAINSWRRLAALGALLGAAAASKAIGTALGAWWAGLHQREIGALAILLNGRGAMQVIIATAGLRMGLLSSVAYTSLLVVSLATSLLVTPAVRRVVGGWQGTIGEQARLAHEERVEKSVLVREQRLLVPALSGTRPELALALFDRAWPPDAELTLLTAAVHHGVPATVRRAVRTRPLPTRDALAAVLEEARLGYGVIGLALSPGRIAATSAAGELLNGTPLPMVVVCAEPRTERGLMSPRRIAVATTGTTVALAAEEVAFGLCETHGARLDFVHVSAPVDVRPSAVAEMADSRPVLLDAARRASARGIRSRMQPWPSRDVAAGIADFVVDQSVDVLVVGTRLRRVDGTPRFGQTVEELMRVPSRGALVVVALPDATPSEPDEPFAARERI